MKPLLHRMLVHAAAGLLACGPAWAQQKSAVSEEDLARAKKDMQQQIQKLNSESIDAARRKHIVPHQDGTRDEALNAHRPQMPKMDALANPAVMPRVDIGALAQRLAEIKHADGTPYTTDVAPKLKVFITMAMPAESIKALMAQADVAGASLVLRGMVNDSLKETAFAIKKLRGKLKVPVAIDPEAFDRYGVTHAPAFVLTKATDIATNASQCAGKVCAPEGFALISGDVSIEYALEKLEQRAPRFKTEARAFLKKIRG